MRAVDTNVLVRLITRDDAGQVTKAERWVQRGAWVSLLALAELTWVLDAVYEVAPAGIAEAVEMLLAHRDLTLQDPDVVAAALAAYRGKASPGFADCLLLEIARKAGHLPLGTFDTRLGKLEGAERI